MIPAPGAQWGSLSNPTLQLFRLVPKSIRTVQSIPGTHWGAIISLWPEDRQEHDVRRAWGRDSQWEPLQRPCPATSPGPTLGGNAPAQAAACWCPFPVPAWSLEGGCFPQPIPVLTTPTMVNQFFSKGKAAVQDQPAAPAVIKADTRSSILISITCLQHWHCEEAQQGSRGLNPHGRGATLSQDYSPGTPVPPGQEAQMSCHTQVPLLHSPQPHPGSL